MGLTFFGLTPTLAKEYRVKFLTQIHEICFHGQGGYSWTEVYEMPLWLRKFTFQKVKEYYNKQNKEMEKAKKGQNSNNKTLIDSDGNVKAPEFLKKTSYK